MYADHEGAWDDLDFTKTVSGGTLILHRRTPYDPVINNLWCLWDLGAIRRTDPEVGDRCCVERFRVSLSYERGDQDAGISAGPGSAIKLVSTKDDADLRRTLFLLYIRSDPNGDFLLQWKIDEETPIRTLKTVNGPHTFFVDATFDWRTSTATVTVDGDEIGQPLPFYPLPLRGVNFYANCQGRHTLGPVEIWY